MTGSTNDREPTREEVDQMSGLVVLEFGADWCPFCQAARPLVDALLARHPQLRHIKVQDGPGRPLGRSFRVKLWPTFVFLREGRVLRMEIRPGGAEIAEAFAELAGSPAPS